MQKVLLITENRPSDMGGIERHCRNIHRYFSNDEDIHIHFLNKTEVKHVYIDLIHKIVCNYKELKQRIRESDCQVIHVHGFASIMAFQALRAAHSLGLSTVYTAHYHPFYTLDNPTAAYLFFHLFLRRVVKRVNVVVSLNEDDTAFFKRYSNQVYMLPNCLDRDMPPDDVLLKYERSRNMVLFVGRSDANKGIDYLSALPSKKYDIQCVTDDKCKNKEYTIHQSISDEELQYLYHRAAVVVVPSRYEAFSYVALEALAAGAPVVMSDRVRIADYLRNVSGVTIFPYGNFMAFRSAVIQSIGRKVDVHKIHQIFSPSIMVKRLKKIYVSI